MKPCLPRFSEKYLKSRSAKTKLDKLNEQEHGVGLLRTIPGIGSRIAEIVVAIIDDPRRLKNCRKVCNYIGFTFRLYQSGEMDRMGEVHAIK